MKLRHLFFACSGVFVMMFSLLLLVVIVFSDEEDGGSGGNLIYGGVNVSQEEDGSQSVDGLCDGKVRVFPVFDFLHYDFFPVLSVVFVWTG